MMAFSPEHGEWKRTQFEAKKRTLRSVVVIVVRLVVVVAVVEMELWTCCLRWL